MQVFFIEEAQKYNILKKIFKTVEIENDKILLNCKCEKIGLQRKINIINKVNRILKINNVKNIVISNKLKQNNEIVNLLYSNGLNIINGKNLFKKLIVQFVEEICKKNNIKIQEKQISITTNGTNQYIIDYVKSFSKNFKTLNVVTNNTHYFKILKEKLWEEDGIIITLTNNKKKALSKSDIILNIDFPEELINSYTIYDESILINLEEKIKIKKKRFHGKTINDYKIKPVEKTKLANFIRQEEYKKFDIRDLAEIYVMNNPSELQNIIIYE